MEVNDAIEVKRGDHWVPATVTAIHGNEFTATINEPGGPVTQRLITQEGETWRYSNG